MIWDFIDKKKIMSVFDLTKICNVKIHEKTSYSVDNEFLLDLILKYDIEKIYDKDNYPYFNGLKVIDFLGGIIKEDLKKDITKTTEIYYRLVESKKIIEFYESETFREIFIIEDVLAIIKNKLVDLNGFYNTPLTILHMNIFEMIKHKDFYDHRVAKTIDYRLKIRTDILTEYFNFLLRLNYKNKFKYDFFKNYEYNEELDIFDFNVVASPTKQMYSCILDNIYDLNEMNKLIMNEDSVYPCKILVGEDYEKLDIDLFSVGSLNTMFLRKHSFPNKSTIFGFYLNKCDIINKQELIPANERIELLFKIDDLNPNLKLSQRFVVYNGFTPATKNEL